MLLPVEKLIIEHKLILQAVEVIKNKTDIFQASQAINTDDIAVIVDFFRTYADRFHHGKEEGILFRALMQKTLNTNDDKLMKELMQEHAFARKTVTALEAAKESYASGSKQAFQQILEKLSTLTIFYPKHIEKEDKHFFYPSMQYFAPQEQKDMLSQFKAFNENFTDKRYTQIIAKM